MLSSSMAVGRMDARMHEVKKAGICDDLSKARAKALTAPCHLFLMIIERIFLPVLTEFRFHTWDFTPRASGPDASDIVEVAHLSWICGGTLRLVTLYNCYWIIRITDTSRYRYCSICALLSVLEFLIKGSAA